MRLINKQPQPASFLAYKQGPSPSFPPAQQAHRDLQASLLKEQGGVCAYCQRKIRLDMMKVEHHCEQAICNGEDGNLDLRLEYGNLFAVCDGQGDGSGELTCDTLKATFQEGNGLPIAIKPTNNAHIASIKYTGGGSLKSSNTAHDQEIQEQLNLNALFLKEMRKKKHKIFMSQSFKGGRLNKAKLKKLLEQDLERKTVDLSEFKSTLSGKVQVFKNQIPGLSEYLLKRYCSGI